MAMQDSRFDDFWGRAAPGMLDLGIGAYGMTAGRREADQRLRAAQGPLYDQAMGASGRALSQAGSMDPQVAAQERFNAQRGLLSGVDAKSEADMLRMLNAKGLLGVANYNPGVEGIAPGTTAMNPYMAAFYAARNARDARMSADSLDAGQAQLDRYLKRSSMLQDQASARQNAGLRAQGTQPSRAAGNMELLKGASSILKDTGMLKTGTDWLKNIFSGPSSFNGGFGMMDDYSGGDWDWF